MANSPYRTCPKCKKDNINRDYCAYCGAVINPYLKRKLERKEREAIEEKLAKAKGNRITDLFEKARVHRNPFIRFPVQFLYSIWVIVLAIGSFLAFLVGYIAA